MSGRERPAPHCRPPRKPTRNEVQRATTSDGDCCDGGEDSNGEDSNRDSEDSNGDGEDSNGDGNGDGSGNGSDGSDGSGDDELQRRRAVHFSTPGQKSPKQNRTHGPSAVKHSKPAGFRDLKTLPENFTALRHGTFFHPPVAHKFRRQPIAARVLHAVKAMEERRFGKLSESGDMN